jgi:hypothetical protein
VQVRNRTPVIVRAVDGGDHLAGAGAEYLHHQGDTTRGYTGDPRTIDVTPPPTYL